MAEIPKPDVKVLGVGLGRTGTLSLSIALNKLGFGPCYHMVTTFQTQGAHIPLWRNVHRGINPTENLYKIFQGFQSGCDYPQALYPDALLAAFPDAKFILSVRPADKWKQSVNKTIYPSCRSMWLPSFISSFASEFYSWTQEVMWQGQFEGDFERTAEVKWDEHVEWVKKVIPPEQLLILKVGEGWEPLCKFLGVDVPDEPYPKVNDASAFKPHILGPRMLPWYAVPLYLINHYVISWF